MTPSPQGRRAVVIEDHDDIRLLLARTIAMRGFAVTTAATGREGLDAVRREGADLITLDLNLPDVDGMEVCRLVREFSDAYLLMVTARPSEADRLSGLGHGADDYISKPFSPRELQARIEAMFRRPRGLAEQADAEELRRAAEVQRSLLPTRSPDVPGYDVAGLCRPSRSVGGDFFDWHPAGAALQLTLADAMGKGMGAALIAATVRAVLRATSVGRPLDIAFTDAARDLEADLEPSDSFVTALTARLHPPSGAVDYVDAGHGLGLHVRGDAVDRLPAGGPPVGAVPGARWTTGRIVLAPGEALVVVSDGLLEAYDDVGPAVRAVGEVLGRTATAREACAAVLDLAGGGSPADDMTVVVLRRALPDPQPLP
ncbi:PP2C family protein-serine/threonine phosphatase [Kocuria sp. M1R5S2]|uniref:PP2C family protein-serine/threonine phosphatase n=1 Tax=Kocuria rhizosphaerae TaxID=3376285 RepID=UPI0037AC32FA